MDGKNALQQIINTVFEQLNITKSPTDLAQEYLSRYGEAQAAAKQLISDNSTKAACASFIENAISCGRIPEIVGLGAGFIGIIYFQLNTIAAVASIAGYDVQSNEIQRYAYECFAANVAAKILRPLLSSTIEKLLESLKVDVDNIGVFVNSASQFGIYWVLSKSFGKRAYNHFILHKPSLSKRIKRLLIE